jgi:hypothetical protein
MQTAKEGMRLSGLTHAAVHIAIYSSWEKVIDAYPQGAKFGNKGLGKAYQARFAGLIGSKAWKSAGIA